MKYDRKKRKIRNIWVKANKTLSEIEKKKNDYKEVVTSKFLKRIRRFDDETLTSNLTEATSYTVTVSGDFI